MEAVLFAPEERPPSPDRVPTLTEVVELAEPLPQPEGPAGEAPLDVAAPSVAHAFEADVAVMEADGTVPSPGELGTTGPVATPGLGAPPHESGLPPESPWRPESDLAPEHEMHQATAAPLTAPVALPAAPTADPRALRMPEPPQDLVAAVLQDLAPQVQFMLEARLREALAPALARAADSFIRDARVEVQAALRDLVEQAVARALRQRSGG